MVGYGMPVPLEGVMEAMPGSRNTAESVEPGDIDIVAFVRYV